MKNLIRKLYTKLEGYFVSKWWERKIYNEMRDIYEESGEVLDIHCYKDSRWAMGFEDMRNRMNVSAPNTVTVYDADWGKMTYIPSDNERIIMNDNELNDSNGSHRVLVLASLV